MIFRFASLQCISVLAAATLMATPPGMDRQSSTNASTNAINSNLKSTTGSVLSDLRNKFRLLQDSSPVTFEHPSLSAAAPPISMDRPRKLSDDRQQWEFMTPAEILGIAPDQTAQNQKRNPNDNNVSLTPLERSMVQRNPSTRFQFGSFYSPRGGNLWGNNHVQTNIISSFFNSLSGMQSDADGQSAFNDNLFANQDSGWTKIFGMPSPPPNSNPVREQQQDMKQFMQLLNRSSAQTAESAPPPNTTLPAAADSSEPLINQIGSSYAPLSSGIGKPTGLAPLPAITRQPAYQGIAPPAWTPQPPPWLSPTPQPFTVPQRKFRSCFGSMC